MHKLQIMVVFHSLTFIESNLQRREYHFVTSNSYSVQYVGNRRKLTFREG